MEILEEISRDMELPNFYASIHDGVRSHLTRLGLEDRLNAIPSGVIPEMPTLIDQTTANQKSFKVRATRKLRQSRIYLDMAAKADDEIKPLLLYYGIAQLWGFFVSSCVIKATWQPGTAFACALHLIRLCACFWDAVPRGLF